MISPAGLKPSFEKAPHLEPSEAPVPILLVDDNEKNLVALEAVLANPGYQLIKARSGEEAHLYLMEGTPALILMNVQIPLGDGYETASIIKGNVRTRDIPIIFITENHASERFLHEGYEHGAIDYIFKPFDARVLRSKVAVLADLHRKTERLLRAERTLRESEGKERERKIAELELRSLRREQIEQKRYRSLVEGIDHGIVWAADPESLAISFISPTAERITGFSPQDWTRNPAFILALMNVADRQSFLDGIARAVGTGSEVQIEHRLRLANGNEAWFQTGMRLTESHSGTGTELRGLSVDITPLKIAESTLARAKKRSDLLAQASLLLSTSLECAANFQPLVLFLRTHLCDFCLLEVFDSASPGLFIATGNREQERAILRAYEAEPFQPASDEAGRVSKQWNAISFQSLEELSGNSARAKALRFLELRSAFQAGIVVRGRLLGLITLARQKENTSSELDLSLLEDIAFRVAASLENTSLYQKAEGAIRLRDEFLSIASHELRTPLTPLTLHIQLMKRLFTGQELDSQKLQRISNTVDICHRQIKRLSGLVEELLDITRISQGRLTLRPESFELSALIRDVAARFASQLEDAGCELKLSLNEPIEVNLDLFRIEQVFVNLLSNAIKYAPGKPIEISAVETGEKVVISCRDFGIGISAADQSRVFGRFERVKSATQCGGLGLGLFIVSQILDAHGGSIRVDSELERGSTFEVTLPKVLVKASSGTVSSRAKAKPEVVTEAGLH